MIKLIVTDVDGTLLDKESKIPNLNKEAIFDCLHSGIGVVLATGKSLNAVRWIIDFFKLKLPQITMAGAVTLNSDLKVIDSNKIGEELYLDAVKTIKQKGYWPLAGIDAGDIFYEKFAPDMQHIIDVGERLLKIDRLENLYLQRNTVCINIPIKEDDPMDKYVREKYSDQLQIVRSGAYFFDILSKDSTKGNALKKLMTLLNLKKEEVAVFGDSYNDLSMFDVAGLRIAVKNSYKEILDKADIITDFHYKGGLGKAVYQHILKKNAV
jgi:Cof subfamily protein (haloacid dehalogenase superfamily)